MFKTTSNFKNERLKSQKQLENLLTVPLGSYQSIGISVSSPGLSQIAKDLKPKFYSPRNVKIISHKNSFNSDINTWAPKPEEIIMGKQAYNDQEKEFQMSLTNTSFFRTFKPYSQSSSPHPFYNQVNELPNSLSKITFSLAHNHKQQSYIINKYESQQKEAMKQVIDKLQMLKQAEQHSINKIKLKTKLIDKNQPSLEKKQNEKMVNEVKELAQKNLVNRISSQNLQSTNFNGETESYLSQQEQLKNIQPQFYLEVIRYGNDQSQGKPSFVEGTTLALYEDKLYVYGGLGGYGLQNQMYEYHLKTQYWLQIPFKGQCPNVGRTGHSVIQYNNSLYYFGGSLMYNRRVKHRETFNELYKFDLVSKIWSLVNTTGDYISPRRHHKVCLYSSKWMLLHGGVDSNEQTICDVSLFNIDKCVWRKLENFQEISLAYHSIINISKLETKNKRQQKDIVEQNKYMKEKFPAENIYSFGGKDDKGTANNEIRKLQFNPFTDLPDKWTVIQTQGLSPQGSYNNTLDYYERLQGLILVGGRKDELSHVQYRINLDFQVNDQSVISEVYIFYLKFNIWQSVQVRGSKPQRCAHSSALYCGSKILLFGGIGNDKYIEADISILEMDSTQVYHRVTRDKRVQQQDKNILQGKRESQITKIQSEKKMQNLNLNQLLKRERKIDLWDGQLPQHSKNKKTLMDRFRNWQNNEQNIRSFLPVPKQKQPKIRYDIFQAFLKGFLLQHLEEIEKLLKKQEEEEDRIKQEDEFNDY